MKFAEERELFAAADMHREYRPPTADRRTLLDYVDLITKNRRLIFLIMALALLLGGLATLALRPVYEANLLIQITDSAVPTKNFFGGDAANVFDIKTPATAEMEIMRSRMVVSPAAEKNQLLVVAEPRYMPIVGRWLARHLEMPSKPALFSWGGWAYGAESISVRQFDVPAGWENKTFIVRAEGEGRYSLRHSSMAAPIQGKVGELLTGSLGNGQVSLNVALLNGETGTEFSVIRRARGKTIEGLQNALKLVERGRQSGIIEATLRDTDAARAAAILNAIGLNYVNQSLERKSAEAAKSIAFLDTQLPALKQQMDRAEGAYRSFRSRNGTVSLPDETKLVLERNAALGVRLLEAQQSRRDLESRFGAQHPAIRALDEQIAALQAEIRGVQGKVRELPGTEQDALRLERDVKVSSELYQQLRNSAMQLQLVREGQTGNARIIDAAIPPDEPIRPNPAIVLGGALSAGLVLSLLMVLIRTGLTRGVTSAREIEAATGLNVYASAIPISKARKSQGRTSAHGSSRHTLALSAPSEKTAEALRQLGTVLQHQMRDKKNNRLMITGPRAGVGVHFVAIHLAAVLAAKGTRILLVDADLRRRSMNQYFGMESAPGLVELIAGTCSRKQAIRATGITGLDLMPTGSTRLNSGDLATSPVFIELLNQASRDYDMVLLTAPPVLSSAETLSLASAAATVLLVTRARKTATSEISESARRLSQAGQFTSGVVLNGVE